MNTTTAFILNVYLLGREMQQSASDYGLPKDQDNASTLNLKHSKY
jgi:hypothetical protein